MKLIPLHNFVLVKRHESEQTASGILIPDAAAEKPDQGEVIAASAGNRLKDGKLHPLEVKVGDRVLFGKYAGHPVKIDGEGFLVMREDDLIAVLES
ncbi:MAG: co-chaperone GroES [Gallionellaceae bacterium]|jgi:chaperonin GroES